MDWATYWILLAQAGIALVALAVPLSFTIAVAGAGVKAAMKSAGSAEVPQAPLTQNTYTFPPTK